MSVGVPNAAQVLRTTLCALAVFVAAVALYAIERAPAGVPGLVALRGVGPWLPPDAAWAAVLRGSGPSFAHTYAFVLLAVAWLARSRREALALGVGAWMLDLALEAAQAFAPGSTALPPALRAWLAGTFDWADVAAQALGAAAAWATWRAFRLPAGSAA